MPTHSINNYGLCNKVGGAGWGLSPGQEENMCELVCVCVCLKCCPAAPSGRQATPD